MSVLSRRLSQPLNSSICSFHDSSFWEACEFISRLSFFFSFHFLPTSFFLGRSPVAGRVCILCGFVRHEQVGSSMCRYITLPCQVFQKGFVTDGCDCISCGWRALGLTTKTGILEFAFIFIILLVDDTLLFHFTPFPLCLSVLCILE